MSTTLTYLAGRTFNLTLSANAGTDVYTLVCLMKQGVTRERAVNKQDTQCGIAKAFGAVDRTMTVEAVNNLTPDALASNVGEASYKLIAQWFEANTVLQVTRKSPTDGSLIFMQSNARIQKLDDAADVAGNQTFSFTLEFEGTFDETA